MCFRGPGVGWGGVRVGSEGKSNAANHMGQQPGSCSAPPPGAASREKWGWGGAQPGGSHHPWGCRTETRRPEPCWEGQPQLAGDIGRIESAGDFTEETITQTKQNQNFIVPSEGLMPGNEWSPCPLPLGDKQNSAG